MIHDLRFMNRTGQHQQKGVTFVEMMVVVVLVGIVVMMSAPYLLSQREKRLLTTERDKLISFLKEAQNKTMIAEDGHGYRVSKVVSGDSVYQICQTGGALCLDRQLRLNKAIGVVWPGDIEFEKLTGSTLSLVVVGMQTNNFKTDFSISSSGVFEMGEVKKI